jgi:hypothetical protein
VYDLKIKAVASSGTWGAAKEIAWLHYPKDKTKIFTAVLTSNFKLL